MAKPVLVLMAAGMGSRYGGLKQLQPMDEQGHLLIDFSVYDALKAGFEDVVFIIKPEMQQDFDATIGSRMPDRLRVQTAYQDMAMLPEGVQLPPDRTKPLGTTHAILCAADAIAGRPFAAVNADDYYGPRAFELLYDFLSAPGPADEHFMVSYPLGNTLSPTGPVSRGVCTMEDGHLRHIVERKKISMCNGGGKFEENGADIFLPGDTLVSMNCWGFRPAIMPLLDEEFAASVRQGLAENPEKFEDILPTAIQLLMAQGRISVRAETSYDRWFGVTYKEDKPAVTAEIAALKEQGVYPTRLWR